MVWTLIKKQFLECFRSFYIVSKTGKARSKAGIIGMYALFAGILIFLCGMFFVLSFLLGDLLNSPFRWLFYALMGVISILFGTFGSVFNTFSTLYIAKDNELLLAMPIPPWQILLARIALVFGMSLLYSGCVWIPAVVYGWIFAAPTAVAVVFDILLILMVALFVTVLTCVLGWFVALVASRIKNKSFLLVAASLLFVAGYYYFCFHMTEFFMSIVTNAEAIGNGIRTWGNLLYQLGLAADGDGKAMLIFCGVTAALFGLCFFVLAKTFTRIVTKTHGAEKKSGKVTVKSTPLHAALLKREWKRFAGSATYMLNCGLGIVMVLALDVLTLFKREILTGYLGEISGIFPVLTDYLPMLVVVGVGMICGMNVVSAPSVSLEGKNLWILRSMPISGRQILGAKLELHLLLNLPAAVVSVFILGWCLELSTASILMAAAYSVALVWTTGAFGLMLGLLRPNFTWTTEAMPIKQSINVLLTMLVGWILPLLSVGACWLLRGKVTAGQVLMVSTVVLAVAAFTLHRWLMTKGGRVFDTL